MIDAAIAAVVDYDTLPRSQSVWRDGRRRASTAIAVDLVTGSLSGARASLLLNLAPRGTVGHIPLPLVADPMPAEASEDPAAHAAAVRAHLASIGLSNRVKVGSPADATSPLAISWQPRDPFQPVQVIISTRDNAGDLRDFIQSLRDRAAVPEALQLLVQSSTTAATG